MLNSLVNYLDFITRTYSISICINDFVGFLYVNHENWFSIEPYLIHNNSFCMRIKSRNDLWDKCIQMKRKIINKCEKEKTIFYGMCYCGVGEYVMPIYNKSALIGAIYVGEYCTNPDISSFLINKIAKMYNLDYNLLTDEFKEINKTCPYDSVFINNILGIVAEYLSKIYELTPTVKTNKLDNAYSVYSTKEYIYLHAIEFIKKNYNKKLTLTDIGQYCNCSISYISRIFNGRRKMNINTYINKLRIDQAKKLLKISNYNISEISWKVGFDDSNYFSNVFKKFAGSSPSDYRKKIQSSYRAN